MARSPAWLAYASALPASPAGATSAKWRASSARCAPRAGAVHALDRLADPPVQLQPGLDRQLLVEDVTDEGVREAVRAAGAWLLGHDAEGRRLRQRTQDTLRSQLAGGPDQRQVELPAHHRGGRQHPDSVGGQRREPPLDHRPHAARDRHGEPAGPLQSGLGGQQAHGLPDEQRVALGPLVDSGGHRLGRRHPGERFDERLHLVQSQPPEGEQLPVAHQLPHRIADAGRRRCRHVTVGRHHQQPGTAKVPCQEPQQQGGVVGRMEIVEDQEQRLRGRRTLEDADDRLEQVEPRRFGLAGGSGGHRGSSKALGESRDDLGDLGRSRSQPGGKGLLVAVLGEGADHLRPRPERRCAPSSQQRPHRTRVPRWSARSARCSASAVLPIPGSPATRNRRPRPPIASSRPASSSAASRSRPRKARDPPRRAGFPIATIAPVSLTPSTTSRNRSSAPDRRPACTTVHCC